MFTGSFLDKGSTSRFENLVGKNSHHLQTEQLYYNFCACILKYKNVHKIPEQVSAGFGNFFVI